MIAPPAPRRGRTWLVPGALVLLALLLAACRGAAAGSATAGAPRAARPAVSGPHDARGIPVGFTPEGWPFRGDPAAPVTLYTYTDFQCPFCARYFVNTEPGILENYVQPGKVRVVVRDLPLRALHPNAPAAHVAAACMADQGAPLYWALYDALFMAQDEWAKAADPAPIFVRLAQEVGGDAGALRACMASGVKERAIAQSVADANARGLDGTPSFRLVNDAAGLDYTLIGAQPYARFAQALDAVLAGQTPPNAAAPQPAAQAAPAWLTTAGLAADPTRPGYTVAGDRTRGSAAAPVVVIEFSDFQCPYCKQHNDKTQPALDAQFVDTGEVRWVYKQFALPSHPQAAAAAIAAECAADQGAFMPMHQALFANVAQWSVRAPNPVLAEMAGALGMDTGAFAACLNDPAKAARVEADRSDGAAYVQGTPTFLIVAPDGQVQIIPGALPLASFSAALQAALDAGA